MDEIASLKNEVRRLDTIISVLVNEVEALRRENAMLKNAHTVPGAEYANDKNKDSISTAGNTIPENMDSINSREYAIDKNKDGINTAGNAIPENMDSINSKEYAIDKNMDGVTTAANDIPKNMVSINTDKLSISAFSSMRIEATSGNISFLTAALRRQLPVRSTVDRANRLAHQLLYLHNVGQATSNDIRKYGGYRHDGFLKTLPKMKREGFICKAAPGKYALTEKSKKILYDVFAERLKKKD